MILRGMLYYGLLMLTISTGLIGGCAPKTKSTRITGNDFYITMDKMIDSLADSNVLRERTPDSPQMILMINKVTNLTSDIITPAEQWMLVARVRDTLVNRFAKEKNIRMVITPEKHNLLRQAGYSGDLTGAELNATHVMRARFMSARRGGVRGKDEVTDIRADYYYLAYELMTIETHELLWSDRFEFKREAVGQLVD